MYFFGTLTNFFVWWYSEGIVRLFKYQGAFLGYLANFFSVRESLVHLLSPWRRLVGQRRPGFDGIRDWMIDNLVSRGIGLVMRLVLIFLFLVSAVLWGIVSLALLVFWLAWPLLIPYGIVAGGLNV